MIVLVGGSRIEQPMPNDLQCNMAVLTAPGYVATHHPGYALERAWCEKENSE